MSVSAKMSDIFTTPDGKQIDVHDMVSIYKGPLKYPMVSDARVHSYQDDSWVITIHSSISNCDLMKTETIEQEILLVERRSELVVRHTSRPVYNSKT